jgi:hypothetical protein
LRGLRGYSHNHPKERMKHQPPSTKLDYVAQVCAFHLEFGCSVVHIKKRRTRGQAYLVLLVAAKGPKKTWA